MAATKKTRERRRIVYTNARKVAEQQESGFEATAFKLPDGSALFKFRRPGVHKIDIVPYVVGKGNPRADKGMVHFERTYYVHNAVGPDNKKYCCPFKNWNKPCPICNYRAKQLQKGTLSDESRRALEPKERQLFCVIDRAEKEKGIQVFETSHYRGFGEVLKDKLLAVDEDHAYQQFFHLDNGMTLNVLCKEEKLPNGSWNAPSNIEMEPRKKPLDDGLLDEAPCLDTLLICPDYDELEKVFLQTKSDGKKKKPKDATDEDEEEDDEDEDDGGDDDDSEEEDEEESDEEGEDEDEGDEGDDEDGDGDDDEDEDEVTVSKGDEVSWVYKKKTLTGVVKKVNEKKGIADVQVKGESKLRAVGLDELTVVSDDDEDEDEEDTEEEEDEKPKTKKKPRKGKKKEDDDGDADDEDDEGGHEDEDTGGEDDEDDFESDEGDEDEAFEDEDEDEDVPVKPKKKRKR